MKTSQWTLETLKEFFQQKFDSLSEAVKKSESSYNDRFASVNEFRNTLADQQRTFMPRIENENLFASHNSKNDQMFENLTDKLDILAKKIDKIENMKAGGNVVWAYVIATISLIGAIIGIALNMTGF